MLLIFYITDIYIRWIYCNVLCVHTIIYKLSIAAGHLSSSDIKGIPLSVDMFVSEIFCSIWRM